MKHEHTLVEIMSQYGGAPGVTNVVRWCRKCGAVVIDVDIDGRTDPGRWMPMQFPGTDERTNVIARAALATERPTPPPSRLLREDGGEPRTRAKSVRFKFGFRCERSCKTSDDCDNSCNTIKEKL